MRRSLLYGVSALALTVSIGRAQPYIPTYDGIILNGFPAGVLVTNSAGTIGEATLSGLALNNGTLSATGAGTGTVTSIVAGGLLTGGTITAAGTISFPAPLAGIVHSNGSTLAPEVIGANLTESNGTLSATGGGGTVTSVATGAGLSGGPIVGAGTITAAYQAGTLTTIGSGLLLSGGTLSNPDIGTVTSVVAGNGLTGGTIVSAGTIAVAPVTAGVISSNGTVAEATTLAGGLGWSAGTLSISAITAGMVSSSGSALEATTLGSGLSWSNATLSNSGILSLVGAGSVSISNGNTITGAAPVAGAGIAVSGQTVSLGTIAASSLLGNAGTVAGVPLAMTVGSGLTLNTAGTLSSTSGGGTVTSVVAGTGLTGGTIVGAGTIALAAPASGIVQSNGTTLSAATIGTGLTFSGGTLSNSGGTGTVTSVAAGGTPGIFTWGGTPIVGAGTLTLTPTGTSGGIPYFSAAASLASSGALTANGLVLGGGAGAAPKVAAGISSNGTSTVSLGVAGTSVGGVVFFNANTGSITLQPMTGALGAVTLSLPAATGTLATTANISTALPSATTSQIYVGTGAAGAAGTASLATGLALSGGTLTPAYQAGTLTTIGTNLTLSGGTLSASGGGTPGGSNTQIQYNNAGSFGGSPNAVFYPTALATPGAPTITHGGTAGGTTYLYSVTARGQLGQTISSPLTTTTTGNATLSGTNYNIITTAAVTGSTSCDVYTLTTPFTSGNWKYVGGVACGSAINDTGAATQNVNGFVTTANNLVDNSAGVNVGQNLLVGGALAVGGASLGYNPSGTSGQSTFSVAQTATGGGGTVYESDPYMASLVMTLSPAIDLALSQPWGLAVDVNVPAANTHKLNAVEGLRAAVNVNGTQNILQGDAINTGFTLGTGATNVGGDTQYSLFTGVNSSNTVGNQTYAMLAYRATVYAQGTTGTLTEADGYRVEQNMCGSNGQPITNCYGFQMQAPTATANVTNFEAFRAGDGHALGSSTSYGFHALGTAFKNLFEGPVGYGHLESTGTRFTATGCGASPTAGHSTAGTFTVTTTGSCASAVVTMGDSQTAPTGWACAVSNQTTANLMRQTASSTTTVSFTGTTASGDTIVFGPCTAY